MNLDGSTALTTDTWLFGCWRDIPSCTNGMSLSLWIKAVSYPAQGNNYYGIISSVKNGLANGFFLQTWDEPAWGGKELTFGFLNPTSGNRVWVDTVIPTLGAWSHWVYTLSYGSDPAIHAFKDGATTTQDYHDCEVCGTTPDVGIRDILVLGNYFVDNIAGNLYFPEVVIDDVMIFEYILSSSEISTLYSL